MDSRILFDALAGVFTALGFDGLGDEVFRDLVIARVVEQTSLLDAGRVQRDLGQSRPTTRTHIWPGGFRHVPRPDRDLKCRGTHPYGGCGVG